MKKLLLAGIAALLTATSAAYATEYQGKLPTPVQRLPKYPPVVCVAPNWATEPCENRQSKSRLSESEPKMQRVGVALEYPKELPDNAPGWFSRKEWLPPKPVSLKDYESCKNSEVWNNFISGMVCIIIGLELRLPSWMKNLDPVAVGWNGVWPNIVWCSTSNQAELLKNT
jgi:hypothetical protein